MHIIIGFIMGMPMFIIPLFIGIWFIIGICIAFIMGGSGARRGEVVNC